MGRVRWSREAERWLRSIRNHIAEDSPEAAARTVRGIYDKAISLQEFPDRGYPHTTRSGQSLRVVLYGHYRIAYTVNDDGDVDILGIYHGALDIERHLP